MLRLHWYLKNEYKMSTKEKTISAGDPLIVGGGNSFYIHDVSGDDVTVNIKRNGQTIHTAEDVQEGWEFFGVPLTGQDRVFTSVEISCATANTIKVETSSERTRLNRSTGSVDIANTPSIQQVINPPTPDELAEQYFSSLATVALQTIVTPAANVNGVIIHGVGIWVSVADAGRFMAKNSAPLSWDDTDANTIALATSASVNPYGVNLSKLTETKIIPAGMGVYLQYSGSISTYHAWLEYTIK